MRILSEEDTEELAHLYISSSLDYCNSLKTLADSECCYIVPMWNPCSPWNHLPVLVPEGSWARLLFDKAYICGQLSNIFIGVIVVAMHLHVCLSLPPSLPLSLTLTLCQVSLDNFALNFLYVNNIYLT